MIGITTLALVAGLALGGAVATVRRTRALSYLHEAHAADLAHFAAEIDRVERERDAARAELAERRRIADLSFLGS